MTKIGIHGSTGRMGQMIIKNLDDDKNANVEVLHAIDEFKFSIPKNAKVTSILEELLEFSDVVIDFSVPQATKNLLKVAINHPKPLVVGTTGLDENGYELLNEASKFMPILYATNMSLGVAVLNKLVYLTSKTLEDFDIEILEQHHRYKKDAPSGTAITLGQSAANARSLNLNDVRVSSRDGLDIQRKKNEIGIMALRGGDVVGRHTVGFYNDGEFVELNHTATSRSTFAKGAIKAAKWLCNKPNGLYNINDCLDLN